VPEETDDEAVAELLDLIEHEPKQAAFWAHAQGSTLAMSRRPSPGKSGNWSVFSFLIESASTFSEIHLRR
jgi:hypothetical protein